MCSDKTTGYCKAIAIFVTAVPLSVKFFIDVKPLTLSVKFFIAI